MEPDRQSSRPKWGHIHADQGALRTRLRNFSGLKFFERQIAWSPIGKAQGPYGTEYIPIKALYELGLKISRA